MQRPKSRGKALIWQCSSACWPRRLRGLTRTDHMLRNGRRAPNRITLSIDNVWIWTRPIAAAVPRSDLPISKLARLPSLKSLSRLDFFREAGPAPRAARATPIARILPLCPAITQQPKTTRIDLNAWRLRPLAPQISQIGSGSDRAESRNRAAGSRLRLRASRCRCLQSRCCANADALTVAALADRGRDTALATDGRSMATVSVIVFVPVASRQDSSLPLSAATDRYRKI
jgi:hypothetical protein